MSNRESCALEWGALMNGEQTVAPDEDDGLVADFLSGDATAFDALFARYQGYVCNIIYGIVGNAEESRDLTQDVFLRVYRRLPDFRHGARFATWLYRISVNRAVDAARRSHRWRWLSIPENSAIDGGAGEFRDEPAALIERRIERDAVQSILMRCPLGYREVLALRYYRDLTIEELAETLGCSAAAAKVRLHRARAAFKKQYVAVYGMGSDGANVEEADATRSGR